MSKLEQFREQYPQYNDVNDIDLAVALHKKSYSTTPIDQYMDKLGVGYQNSLYETRSKDSISGDYIRERAEITRTQEQTSGSINKEAQAGRAEGIGRAGLQGATFGFGDEVVAGGAALLAPLTGQGQGKDLGERYRAYLGRERGRLGEFRKTNPIAAYGSEIAGAIPTAIIGGGQLAGRGATIGQRALSGMAVGSGQGAVYGGGAADENRLKGAAVGGTTGAVLGGGFPYIGRGLQKAGRVIGIGKTPRGIAPLSRALADDDIAVNQIGQRLGDIGEGATVTDLGANLQRQAGALAAQPGKAQKIIRDAITQRTAGRSGRVAQDLSRTVGSTKPAFSIADDIAREQSQTAKPLYDAVRPVLVDVGDNIKDVLSSHFGKSALRKAARVSAVNADDAGRMTVGALDQVKQSLDDMASAAQRAGRNNEARVIGNLSRQLRTAVDEQVPSYGQAREAFAGYAAVKDALETGTDVFKSNLHPNQLRQIMQKMTSSEREALVKGAQSSIQDMMGNISNDALKLRNMFNKSYNLEKLRLLIGDDAANALVKNIQREATFGQTAGVVTANSETAARAAAMAEVAPKQSLIQDIGNLKFGDIAARMGGKVFGKASQARQSVKNEALANMLMSRQPNQQTIQSLLTLQNAQKGIVPQGAIEKALLRLPAPIAGISGGR